MASNFTPTGGPRSMAASPITSPDLQKPAPLSFPPPDLSCADKWRIPWARLQNRLAGRGFSVLTLTNLPFWVLAPFLHGLLGQSWHFYHTHFFKPPSWEHMSIIYLLGMCQGVKSQENTHKW